MRYRPGSRTAAGRTPGAASSRYAAAVAAHEGRTGGGRKKSRRQLLDELYGLHNPDEWSEEYLELLLGDLLKALGLYSYHTKRSDRSDKGWPDETIVGGREVLYAELKNAQRKLEPEQVDVVHRLNSAGALVRIYRPADWLSGVVADEIRAVAQGPGRPAVPWPAHEYRCGCEIALVATVGHRDGCPIERTVRKTATGRPGKPWWKG